MNFSGDNIEDIDFSSAGSSTGLFDDVGHWIAFVQEPEFSTFGRRCGWIDEDSAVFNGPVDISHHTAYISGTVGLSLGWILLVLDIVEDSSIPFMSIAFVDGIDFSSFWDFHVGIRQDEFTNCRIVHETIDTVAQTQDHHSGRSVEGISSSYLLPARLKGVLEGWHTFSLLSVDPED